VSVTDAASTSTGHRPTGLRPTGLRRRILRGSIFELGGYASQQLLRIAGNLILTRLLYPAAFGQAAIVSTISIGLVMFSDVALLPCVVQSKRGDDVAFLNTAFTFQVFRGLALAFIMAALAKPSAWFYREPGVESLIYISSLQLVINGFHSTSVFTLRRRLSLGWLNGLDLGTSIMSTGFTLILAHAYPTPRSLILGNVFGSLFTACASHFLPVEYRNRFHWDKDAAREIRRFGSWVIGSSAATFFGSQGDRILLGRFLGAAWLGVYGIAVNLSDMVGAVISRVISGVLYPVLSEAGRDPTRDLSVFFYRLRLRLDALSMTAAGLLSGAGGWVVHTMWDQRYANAAWIVQVMAIRIAIALIVATTETCLFALGQTRYVFARSVARLAGTMVFLPLGWYLGGVRGLVWGTVAAEVPTLLAVWPRSRALGILRLRREALAVAIFLVAAAVGRFVSPLLPTIHLHSFHK
jgi:O-antigen/teichoic acid export membrane protein